MVEKILQEKPDFSKLPGGWDFDLNQEFKIHNQKFNPRIFDLDIQPKFSYLNYYQDYNDIRIIDNFLNTEEIKKLNQIISLSPNLENVGIQGMMDSSIEENIGSKRTTVFSAQLMKYFSKKFDYIQKHYVKMFQDKIKYSPYYGTDIHDIPVDCWEYFKVSPLFRFMEYKFGGQHYTHYDAGYIYKFNSNYRTLFSYVIYLTDNEEGGETRFINDNQIEKFFIHRNLDDWKEIANEESIILKVKPKAGRILIFPHRLPHDVSQYFGNNPRRIIRGDLIFKKHN